MRSSRSQVKTPVGNKTKRGSELEGTPKTPGSLEFSSPVRSSASTVEFSPLRQEQRQRSSGRPLHRNLAQQAFINVTDVRLECATENPPTWQEQIPRENTSTDDLQLALSPLCLNVGLYHHQRGERTAVKKSSTPLRPTQLFAQEDSLAPQNHGGRAGQGNDRKGGTTLGHDEGKIASSQETFPCEKDSRWPSMFSAGCNRVMIWNNVAFNSQMVCGLGSCDNMASTTSSLPSTSLRGVHEAGLIDQTENCYTEAGHGEAHNHSTEAESCFPTQCSAPRLRSVDDIARAQSSIGGDNPPKLRNDPIFESEEAERLQCVARQIVPLESSAISSPPSTQIKASFCVGVGSEVVLEEDTGQAARDNLSPIWSGIEKDQRPNYRSTTTVKGSDEALGLKEIDLEIQKLTQRLKELQVQKQRRYEEIRRQRGKGEAEGNAKCVKAGPKRSGDGARKEAETKGARRIVAAKLLSRNVAAQAGRSGEDGAGKDGKGGAGCAATAVMQSPVRRGWNGSSSTPLCGSRAGRGLEETRRVGVPASCGKLSELRRSVSACSRRANGGDEPPERSRVSRRLSMSAAAPAPMNMGEGGVVMGQEQRRGAWKPRFVSSRYDACRMSSASCAAMGVPAAPQPSSKKRPSTTASASSPLKTLRSGYPSRSGFVTPTKDRLDSNNNSTPAATDSNLLAAATAATLPDKAPAYTIATRPPRNIGAAKSTAALYQCLESLVEDSKHFFKSLSPARASITTTTTLHLPHVQQPLLKSLTPLASTATTSATQLTDHAAASDDSDGLGMSSSSPRVTLIV